MSVSLLHDILLSYLHGYFLADHDVVAEAHRKAYDEAKDNLPR